MPNTEFATDTDARNAMNTHIAQMNTAAPDDLEWCEYSRRYVTLGMAVGIN